MKNIVLYAPPAAGKGTQCELLEKEFGYKVISIGQVLRNARNPHTEIGKKIIEAQDKGDLVSDDIVINALYEEINKLGNIPVLLEGFPRNLNQARLLDTILKNYIVINLSINKDIAMQRTLGRLNCEKCNKIYNTYFSNLSPKVSSICDMCGGKLIKRTDDNEQSFSKRFQIYEENAPQIIEFYKNKNIYYNVDSSISKEETYRQIKEILG